MVTPLRALVRPVVSLALLLTVVSPSSLPAQPVDEAAELESTIERAKEGDPNAMFSLAANYEEGTGGVKKNEKEAVRLYTACVAKEFHAAALPLGLMHLEGRGTAKNAKEAEKYFKISAGVGGFEGAYYQLGMLYSEGGPMPRDDEKAYENFAEAADRLSGPATLQMARCYRLGRGVAKDLKEAVLWALAAKRFQEPKANEELRLALAEDPTQSRLLTPEQLAEVRGEPPPVKDVVAIPPPAEPAPAPVTEPEGRDYSEFGPALNDAAKEKLAKAEAGDTGAMQDFAWFLRHGHNGVTQDRAAAAGWYRLAASRGDARAMNYLGELMLFTKDDPKFPQNIAEGLEWLRKSARAGNASAAMSLGAIYDRDASLVTPYKPEALKWYLVAAELGETAGQYAAGLYLVEGRGVPQNIPEGVKWLKKAAAKGDTSSKQMLERLGPAAGLDAAEAQSALAGIFAPVVRDFEQALAAATDEKGRKRAVFHFSTALYQAGAKSGATKGQMSEFLLKTLTPHLEKHLGEAYGWAMEIDSAVYVQEDLKRFLPPHVYEAVRNRAAGTIAAFNAAQQTKGELQQLEARAASGSVADKLAVARRYLETAAQNDPDGWKLHALKWFRAARTAGDTTNVQTILQLEDELESRVDAAITAKNWARVAQLSEWMGDIGDPAALYMAALLHFEGPAGMTRDVAKAKTLFQRAAQGGEAAATPWIEFINSTAGDREKGDTALRNGDASAAAKDLDSAKMWYRTAESLGHAGARERLDALLAGKPLPAGGGKDFDDGLAAYNSGNFADAKKHWLAGASKNNAGSMFNLGVLALQGHGERVNLAAARDWFVKAKAAGADTTKAMAEVDGLLAKGGQETADGIAALDEKRYTEALAPLTAGFNQGSSRAAYQIGRYYESGDPAVKDLAKALEWYGKSGEMGNADGKSAVKRLQGSIAGAAEFEKGQAAYAAKKFSAAAEWYEKAANLGNVPAMAKLGILYMEGAGEIFDDRAKARVWLQKASDAGDEMAGIFLQTLKETDALAAMVPRVKEGPPKGPSLVKGSTWSGDEILAALRKDADHLSLAIALRVDGKDLYYGDYLRILSDPAGAKVVKHTRLSNELESGHKAGGGAWAAQLARDAIAARRGAIRRVARPVDSAELRAKAAAGDPAAAYALFTLPSEELKLGALSGANARNYPQMAELALAKNFAPALWIAADLRVNQVDKSKNDPLLRAEYLRRSAQAGDAQGAYRLAQLYFESEEPAVAPNFTEAEYWFIEAGALSEEKDFTVMRPELALTLLYSAMKPIGFNGVELRSDEPALRWVRELQRRGGPMAQHAGLLLAKWRKDDKTLDNRMAKLAPEVAALPAAELTKLTSAARSGDTSAALTLGTAYASGRGARQNDALAVEFFQIAAAKGNGAAMRALANQYARGYGVKKDPVQRVAWLEKAGVAGDASAWLEMANLLHFAHSESGVKEDYPRAIAAYEKALAGGEWYAAFNLATMHDLGRGLPKSPEKRDELLLRAARAGHVPSMDRLGGLLFQKEDFKGAVEWLQKAIEGGNATSNYTFARALGKAGELDRAIAEYLKLVVTYPTDGQIRYELGALQEKKGDLRAALETFRAVAKNDSQYNTFRELGISGVARLEEELDPKPDSIPALRKRAAGGDAEAMMQLVMKIAPTDKPAAFEWLKKAAAKEHPQAMLVLGLETARTDKTAALALIEKAANAGNLEAKFRLGFMKVLGQEVPKDVATGVKWITDAADGGFAPARVELGRALVVGTPDIPAEPARGIEYLKKAAAQRAPQAALLLGEVYERGHGGVKVDPREALRWYREAERGGLKEAGAAASRLEKR